MTKLCLDLFSGTGGFSAAFDDSPDWETFRVDNSPDAVTDLRADVMELRPADLPSVDVVTASPPCPLWSPAGNHDQWDFDTKQPVGDDAREHIALVYHTLGLIHALSPDYWFLENPRGRLRWYLGRPTGTVTYCQYGKTYQKPTDLWGDHPPGLTYRSCAAGGDCHTSNTEDDGTAATASMPDDYAERAAVPYELSQAILDAVEGQQEQQTFDV